MRNRDWLYKTKLALSQSTLFKPFRTNIFSERAINQTESNFKFWHVLIRKFFVYPITHPMLSLKVSKIIRCYKEVIADDRNHVFYLKKKPRLKWWKSYIIVAGHSFPEEEASNLSVINKHTYTLVGTKDQVMNNGDMSILWLIGFHYVDKLEKEKKGSRHDAYLRMKKDIKYGSCIMLYPTGGLNNTENLLAGPPPYSGFYNLAKESKQWYCRLLEKPFGKYEWFKKFTEKYGVVEVLPIAAHTSNNSHNINIAFSDPVDITKMSREDAFEWFSDTISGFEMGMMQKEISEIADVDRVDSKEKLKEYEALIDKSGLLKQKLLRTREALEHVKLLKESENNTVVYDVEVTLEEMLDYLESCYLRNSDGIKNALNIECKRTIGGTFENKTLNVVASLPFDDPETGAQFYQNVVIRATLGEDPLREYLKERADTYFEQNRWDTNSTGLKKTFQTELSFHPPRTGNSTYRIVEGKVRKLTFSDIDLWKKVKAEAESELEHMTTMKLQGSKFIKWWEKPDLCNEISQDLNLFSFFESSLNLYNEAKSVLKGECVEADPWSFYDRLDYSKMGAATFGLVAPGAVKRRVLQKRKQKYDLLDVIIDRYGK